MTMSGGVVMPSWFNIEGIGSDGVGFFPLKEDPNDIDTSTKLIQNLINTEAGILGEYGQSRVMIGGISGGGVIALSTLLQSKDKLAGCAALSTYIAGINYNLYYFIHIYVF